MGRGDVRLALVRIIGLSRPIRNSGRLAWSLDQLKGVAPALESEKEVGSSEFRADVAHFPNKHKFGIQGI